MKKNILLIILTLFSVPILAQNNDEKAIEALLATQVVAWNAGNLDYFMEGYWQDEKLKFIGKNGVTCGWKATLDRYKKNYPTALAMGKLAFELLSKEKIDAKHYFVIGKWKLQYTDNKEVGGHFSLLFRKIKGQWRIIADHSS